MSFSGTTTARFSPARGIHRVSCRLLPVKDARGFPCYCLVALGGEIHVLRRTMAPADEECEMENIAKYQPRWMLLCAAVCLIISPCLANENQSASQEIRRLQEMLRAIASPPALQA